MARNKFQASFTPRSKIDGEVKTTKNIAFGNLSQQELDALKEKLNEKSTITEPIPIKDESRDIIPEGYEIKKIPRNQLENAPDEWNFFSKPDKSKLLMMAESIYVNGLLQPIVVRELGEDRYQILAGHTRNTVFGILYDMLGDDKYLYIDAIIYPKDALSDNQAQDIICDTNFMQRGNLPPREMTKCIMRKAQRLKEDHSYGGGDIASKIAEEYHIKRSMVFVWKKLANLIDEFNDIVENKVITVKNAYKLACLSQEDQRSLFCSHGNFITNESLRTVKPSHTLKDIEKIIEEQFGVKTFSVRYEVPETFLKNSKDTPILIYVSDKDKERLLEAIRINGGYIFGDNGN